MGENPPFPSQRILPPKILKILLGRAPGKRDEAQTVRYAVKLVEGGAVSKAMRILESRGLGDINVPHIPRADGAKTPPDSVG